MEEGRSKKRSRGAEAVSAQNSTIPKGGLQAKYHAKAYARYRDTCTLSPLQVRLLLHQLRHHSYHFTLILSVLFKPRTIVRRQSSTEKEKMAHFSRIGDPFHRAGGSRFSTDQ